MSLTVGIDVVPPGLAVASCTAGPLGLALIVCIILVWRLQSAEPAKRKPEPESGHVEKDASAP